VPEMHPLLVAAWRRSRLNANPGDGHDLDDLEDFAMIGQLLLVCAAAIATAAIAIAFAPGAPGAWTMLYAAGACVPVLAIYHVVRYLLWSRGAKQNEKNNEALRAAEQRLRRLAE
jgi:membrane protein implicated in regulation of membrane protease activity